MTRAAAPALRLSVGRRAPRRVLRAGVAVTTAAVLLGVTAAPATAGPARPAARAAAAAAPAIPVLHISPTGGGRRDGRDWANAGTVSDLPRFVTSRPRGGQIWLRGDAGPYLSRKTVDLRSGGADGAPVVIRGVDASGRPTVRPVFLGNRVAPYRPKGAIGHQVFELQAGSRNLVFSNLAFTNVGSAFVVGGDTRAITLSDLTATNVRFFLDNLRAKHERTANATGLTVRQVKVNGFSKSAIRLRYDSSNILVEDVVADSRQQDGDNFAMGVALQDRTSKVVLRRVTMAGSRDTKSKYWNGDGFATERLVSDVLFQDTRAIGSTDGGYDLKSTRTRLVRAHAEDNKRNFRFWANDTTVNGCTAARPVRRGGTGGAAQVWLGARAKVVMSACRFVDGSAPSSVFQLEADTRLTVRTSTLTPTPGRRLSLLEQRAVLDLPPSMR